MSTLICTCIFVPACVAGDGLQWAFRGGCSGFGPDSSTQATSKSLGLEMEVSINGGTPKWMVYKEKSHLEIDDLGVPLF